MESGSGLRRGHTVTLRSNGFEELKARMPAN